MAPRKPLQAAAPPPSEGVRPPTEQQAPPAIVDRAPYVGVTVLYSIAPGIKRPLLVTNAWTDGNVNGTVFLDGQNDEAHYGRGTARQGMLQVASVKQGQGVGEWQWAIGAP